MAKAKKAKAPKRKTSLSPVASAALANPPVPHYNAAGQGRRLGFWQAPSSGPNRANHNAPTLRNRARDIARNDWAGHAIPAKWAANLVGTGIIARPNTPDANLKTRLVNLWDDWAENADADGIFDLYGLQSLVARNWIESGEVFVRLRPRLPQDGLEVPLQIQVIESDLLPIYDSVAPNGNRITQGIEFNGRGQRVAYWMHRVHPGEGIGDTGTLSAVPAELILHIYEPTRPGQLRGVSEFSAILAKLRGVSDFDDAVLERQKIGNLFAGFVERAPESGDAALDPLSSLPVKADYDGMPIATLEPATMQELAPGETVKFSDPPDAGAGYADFTRAQYQGIAAGTGLPYELLTGDLNGVSDRALRVIITEFRRHCQQRQWHVLIPQFCKKVRAAWVDAALLAGGLSKAEADAARRVTWVPQGWAYIHPVQDVQAARIAVESGFTSRSAIITERGDDPEAIDADRAADLAREVAAGLAFPPQDPSAPDPATLATIKNIDAQTAQTRAQEQIILSDAARRARESEAAIAHLQAQAAAAKSESDLNAAKASESAALARLAESRLALAQADAIERQQETRLATARAENESAARIAAIEDERAAARDESQARLEALSAAEAYATEQRTLVLAAEQRRVTVADLEVEAAELGLAELRGEK